MYLARECMPVRSDIVLEQIPFVIRDRCILHAIADHQVRHAAKISQNTAIRRKLLCTLR